MSTKTSSTEKTREQDDNPTKGLTRLSLQTSSYFSRSLGREQPCAYLVPNAEKEPFTAKEGYPLLVLLHGLSGGYRDWPTRTRIARYAAEWNMVVAFPEGGDGWYTNAADGSANWEDDLLEDFVSHLQQSLPLALPGKHWAIGGLSMGGYGAVKIALKRPDLFLTAFSHSGSLAKPTMREPHPIFGDPEMDSAMRRKENPFSLAEQVLCRWPTERPRLLLDCGTEDEFLACNRRFKDHLTFIGYPHQYVEMAGDHSWPYWDRAFRTVLPKVAEMIGAERADGRAI